MSHELETIYVFGLVYCSGVSIGAATLSLLPMFNFVSTCDGIIDDDHVIRTTRY